MHAICAQSATGTGTLPRRLGLAFAILIAASGPAGAAVHDRLTIGVTQYPATLNPNIDVMAAKNYVLGFALRPFTVYDADWKLVCLLCTELPTLDNGRAVLTTQPDGSKGVDPTWLALIGRVEKVGGADVTVDDAYLTESIHMPMAKIVDGFPPAMPPNDLTDADIKSVILFIKTLK